MTKLFPSRSHQFLILDAACQGELEPETLKVRFNQNLRFRLSDVNSATIRGSNLYRHLQAKFPTVVESIDRLFEEKENGLVHLPKIASEMQINDSQTCPQSSTPSNLPEEIINKVPNCAQRKQSGVKD